MNLRDLIGGLFWFATAVFVCTESASDGLGTFRNPGPGFLPFWSAVVLGVLSAIFVLTKIAGRSEKRTQVVPEAKMKWEKVVLVVVCLFAYTMLIDTFGYMLTTFAMLFFLFGVIAGSKLWARLLLAFITAITTFILFNTWLGVQLPKGILGF
jgi:hypothetical protein